MKMHIAKLMYEVLGSSIGTITDALELPAYLVSRAIDKDGWSVLWPQEALSDPDPDQAGKFLRDSKLRLDVYKAAVGLVLSAKYTAIELNLVDIAYSLSGNEGLDARELRVLTSSLLALKEANEIQIPDDLNAGLHEVIFKNLSGQDIEDIEELKKARELLAGMSMPEADDNLTVQ